MAAARLESVFDVAGEEVGVVGMAVGNGVGAKVGAGVEVGAIVFGADVGALVGAGCDPHAASTRTATHEREI